MVFGNNDPFDEQSEDPAGFLTGEFEFTIDEVASETASEDEMCEHDDARETIPKQEWAGATGMGFGGNFGTTDLVSACPICAKAWPVELQSHRSTIDDGFGGW